MTKSETGTWDSGTWNARTRGRGTRGLGDVGREDSGTWDARTRGRAGTRGHDKQKTPAICAEFVEYNFRWSRESYFMLESLLVVADGIQLPWFGRTCFLAYLT